MDDAPATDLDALVRRVDPDRWMSSRFIGEAGLRADVVALYAFDHELARAPKVASNPLIGEIRLTWWREALDEIYEGRPVRRHPTAEALADVVRRRGLAREPLEAMIDARYDELDGGPLAKDQAMKVAFGTAGAAASLAIQIIDGKPETGFASGWSAIWALSRMVFAGELAPDQVTAAQSEVRISLAEARTVERSDISNRAFPAVVHATLAPLYAKGRQPSALEKQVRLVWAVAQGRI